MAARKGLCPTGEYMGPNGKCIKGIAPFKPVPKPAPTTKVTETAEEKAERIAKEKAAAVAAEQKRISSMTGKEFRKEKKGINRNVKIANLKEGKEGRGFKMATQVLGTIAGALGAASSGVAVAKGIKELKEKELKEEKKGGIVKTKMKTGGTMKPKMQMGGNTPPMQRPGQKKDTSGKPIDYSKMGTGVLPAGTVVDSYYSRNAGKNKIAKTIDKIKRLPINKRSLPARKMQMGGPLNERMTPSSRVDITVPPRSRKVVGRESKNDKNIKLYNKKKPDGLSPNEIKTIKGMTPPPVRNKMQMGGGIPITGRAAARKVAKGKGAMTYKYGNMDPAGTGNNKGAYVKFGKDKESGLIGGVQFKSMKGKARPVKKMGGVTKKK